MDRSLFLPESWADLFIPEAPLLEIFVRGSVIYLLLFFGLRLIFKRETAGTSITDLLVIVLIADAVQNGMADGYSTITDAILLGGTIMGWAWTLDAIAYHFPAVRGVIQPRPIILIKDGRVIERALHKELITYDELISQVRQQGVERIEDVKVAHIESSGAITVIPKDWTGRGGQDRRRSFTR